MTKELDEKLVKSFPNLYTDRYGNKLTTCMCWGFECNDGWFDLIYDLSEKLEELIIEYKRDNRDREFTPRALQVKEKYGTLRFYMSSATDEMYELIDEAEEKSAKVCEICGDDGIIRVGSWVRCLCDGCFKEYK